MHLRHPIALFMRPPAAFSRLLSLHRLTLRVFFGLAALCAALPARAHRPSESTAQFRWDHDRLEVQLIVSLQIATLILADENTPGINAENFPAIRAQLATKLLESFRLEHASRPVRPDLLSLTLSPEGEIACLLALPDAAPAPLAIHAAFLELCPPDSFCWIRLSDADERPLSQKLLVRTAPRAALPAPDSPSETAPTASTR